MTKYVYGALSCILLFFILAFVYTCKDLEKYKELYLREYSNVRAYEAENDSLKNDIRQFSYTIADLKTSKDTVNQKIIQVVKEAGIKEKTLERVEYIPSVAVKTDTIEMKDTIFKETMVPVDTVIGDEWYNLDLKLEYPSTIITTPTFKSEKYVIVSTKKEYVKPRSRWFFIRWFQKKKKYVGVDVIEKNPYIENGNERFIEVVDN